MCYCKIQLIMDDNVLINLVLHLPLNLIWRLAGLNKQLNKILMLEQLWLERCRKEFKLLHNKIPCYRIYFLIRSRSCYGKIYEFLGDNINHIFPEFTRVVWVRNIANTYMILNDRKLYLRRKDGTLFSPDRR